MTVVEDLVAGVVRTLVDRRAAGVERADQVIVRGLVARTSSGASPRCQRRRARSRRGPVAWTCPRKKAHATPTRGLLLARAGSLPACVRVGRAHQSACRAAPSARARSRRSRSTRRARRVTPSPAIGLARGFRRVRWLGLSPSRALGGRSLICQVQHDGLDAVAAQLLDARLVGELCMPPRMSSTAGMSKVLLPIGILWKPSVEKYCQMRSCGAVGRQVKARARQADSALAGCGTTGWPMCPAPSPTRPISRTARERRRWRRRGRTLPPRGGRRGASSSCASARSAAARRRRRAARRTACPIVNTRPGTRTPFQPGA